MNNTLLPSMTSFMVYPYINCDLITYFSYFSDCLQKFVDVEELAESERFYCNACKCKQKSTKKFWIRRLPNVIKFNFE